MSVSFSLTLIAASIVVPILIFIIIFRHLIFHLPPREAAVVLEQRGYTKEREDYFLRSFLTFPKGSSALIVAGEANPEFHTEAVVNAMRKAARVNGVVIKMICGPTILVKNEKERKSDILDIAKEGLIELFLSRKRQRRHFRVSTTGRLYWERPHIPGERGCRIGFNIPKNYFEAKPYLKKFEQLLSEDYVVESHDPYRDFILVTREEQDALYNEVLRRGKDYNECDIEYLRQVIEEIRRKKEEGANTNDFQSIGER